MSQSSHRPALALALVLCALKGVAAAWVTPAFQTPDEYGHYDYVLYLSHIEWGEFLRGHVARPQAYHDITTDELWAVTQASGTESHLRGQGLRRPLPTLGMQVASARAFVPTDSHDSLARKTIVPAQFNYPMLYYGGVALVVKAVRMTTPNPVIAYYTARTVSLALLLLTVYFTWATARVVFAEHGGGVPLATLFVALQPQLTLLGISVQSDTLTVLLVTMCSACAVRYVRAPSVDKAVLLGLLTAALFLTKLHAAVVMLGALVALVILTERARPRTALARVLVVGGLALAVGGWWYLRTLVLYGSPTGVVVGEFHTALFGSRRANLHMWLSMFPLTYTSFWGNWGWLEVPLPSWALWGLSIASVLSGLSACRPAVVRAILRSSTVAGAVYWGLLAAGYALVMMLVAVVVGPVHNNQGRHWLPIVILPALALGLSSLGAQHGKGKLMERITVAGWTILLLAANLLLIKQTRAFYPTS